jgi:hypothetical protein
MTPGDWILFAVVGALATNHLLVRLPNWETRAWMFWLVQLSNLCVVVYVLAIGLPGFDGSLRVVNWVFGLLFVIRMVQNNNRWGKTRLARRKTVSDADDAKKTALTNALRRGEAAEVEGADASAGPTTPSDEATGEEAPDDEATGDGAPRD